MSLKIKWIGSPNYYNKSVFPKKHITLHWGVTTLAGIDRTFQNPNSGSSQYGIEGNVIHQYVNEEDYAWADANTYSNTNGISVEHSGGYVRDGSRVKPSPATHETSARLCADIAKRHNMGRLVVGKNLYRHSDWVATMCPGTLDVEWIARRANEIAKLHIKPSGDITPTREEDLMPMKIIAPYQMPDRAVIGGGLAYAFPNRGEFEHFLNLNGLGTPDTVKVTVVGDAGMSKAQRREVFETLVKIYK